MKMFLWIWGKFWGPSVLVFPSNQGGGDGGQRQVSHFYFLKTSLIVNISQLKVSIDIIRTYPWRLTNRRSVSANQSTYRCAAGVDAWKGVTLQVTLVTGWVERCLGPGVLSLTWTNQVSIEVTWPVWEPYQCVKTRSDLIPGRGLAVSSVSTGEECLHQSIDISTSAEGWSQNNGHWFGDSCQVSRSENKLVLIMNIKNLRLKLNVLSSLRIMPN